MCTYIHKYIYLGMSVYMNMYMYVYIHIYIYIYMYIYIGILHPCSSFLKSTVERPALPFCYRKTDDCSKPMVASSRRAKLAPWFGSHDAYETGLRPSGCKPPVANRAAVGATTLVEQ